MATSRSGEAGDSDIAQAIADLADHDVPGHNLSINDMYRGVVTNVASRRASFEFLVDNQEPPSRRWRPRSPASPA